MTTEEALWRVSRTVTRLARSDTSVKRRNARKAFARATRLLRQKADEEYPRIARPQKPPSEHRYVSRDERGRLALRKLSRDGWVPVPPERKNQMMADCLVAKVPVKFVREISPGRLRQTWPWVRGWVLAVPPGDVALMRECRGNATKQKAVLAVELLSQKGKEDN